LSSLISAPVSVDVPGEAPTEVDTPPPSTSNVAGTTEPPAGGSAPLVVEVAIEDVRPSPSQPRQDFDETALTALAESIRSAGLMQPIVVRPARSGGYELIAGERRWRAAERIGLQRIPAIVRDADDQVAAEWSLVENLQREDLNPIERAVAFQRLIDEFKLTHQEVAERVGIDRSNVSNHLRLLDLEDDLQQLVREGLLSLGHARTTLGITNLEERRRLAIKAVREGWSVRELERRARAPRASASEPTAPKPASPARAHVKDLERRLGEHLGTRVNVRSGRKKGTGSVTIAFYSFDEFEGLMQRLGFEC
jgi:ParB family chromosome partitioning protein